MTLFGRVPRVAVAAALLAAVILYGTLGYELVEGYRPFDAFYMTITTLSTVGGGELHPLSLAGKWHTLVLISVGVGVMTYTVFTIISYVIEGQLQAAVVTRRMRRRVEALENHFILCGFGRVGNEIASDFTQHKVPFVIVDVNQESLTRAASHGYLVVLGDASDLDVLKTAGLQRARGLVTAMDRDEANIYVTLTARVFRPDIYIVARANRADAEPKLRLAGANRIISPYTIGGRRMASLATRPLTIDFVDTVLSAGNADLVLEDFTIGPASGWIGRQLGALIEGTDTIVLAIKRRDHMMFRPLPETLLEISDELVAAGSRSAIAQLEGRITLSGIAPQ